jgi:DNA replication protein DnaC
VWLLNFSKSAASRTHKKTVTNFDLQVAARVREKALSKGWAGHKT